MWTVDRVVSAVWLWWLLATGVEYVAGHGRLIEPPGRSSAWRYGFKTPTNVNDHQLYCGGFTRQWRRNGGKCGVCGDPWDSPQPRLNEAGGKYGRGVIVRTYKQAATILIGVELTANHGGFFEMRLCPTNSPHRRATQQCLDRHVLTLHKDGAHRYYPDRRRGKKLLRYLLPRDLFCSHCVLQWRYVAGNNWGHCGNGTSRTGCGPQEEFRACADVRITTVRIDEIDKQISNDYTIHQHRHISKEDVNLAKTTSRKPHDTSHKKFGSTHVKPHSVYTDLEYYHSSQNAKQTSTPKTTFSPYFSRYGNIRDRNRIHEYLRRNFSENYHHRDLIINNDLSSNDKSSRTPAFSTPSLSNFNEDEQLLNEIVDIPVTFRGRFINGESSNLEETRFDARVEGAVIDSSRVLNKETTIAIVFGVVFIVILLVSLLVYVWCCRRKGCQCQLYIMKHGRSPRRPIITIPKGRKIKKSGNTGASSGIPISEPIRDVFDNDSFTMSEDSDTLPRLTTFADQNALDKGKSTLIRPFTTVVHS